VGRGERWEFHELSSETSLRSGGRLLYLDRFHLQPASGAPAATWAMERGTYLGTGLYLGEHAEAFAEKLHAALPEAGVDNPESNVAAVRLVTTDGPAFHRCREIFKTT
jgi:urease accessory protein UreH